MGSDFNQDCRTEVFNAKTHFLFFLYVRILEQIKIAITIKTAYDKRTKNWLDSLVTAY